MYKIETGQNSSKQTTPSANNITENIATTTIIIYNEVTHNGIHWEQNVTCGT